MSLRLEWTFPTKNDSFIKNILLSSSLCYHSNAKHLFIEAFKQFRYQYVLGIENFLRYSLSSMKAFIMLQFVVMQPPQSPPVTNLKFP